MNDIEAILRALQTIRVPAQPEESEIHEAVAAALEAAGIEAVHEFRIAPGRRIDFACGDVGIEIKKGRPRSAVLRGQLCRYLDGTPLRAVILVSQLPCTLPEEICGKRVYTVSLNRLWGVALH